MDEPPAIFPGLAEATARENLLRDLAYAGLPELVCGIELCPLTARHVLRLSLTQSPFFAPPPDRETLLRWLGLECITEVDVARFLWACSPRYRPGARVARWRFLRSVRRFPLGPACEEIFAFVEESFADKPGGTPANGPSYWSWLASYVFAIARATGWTEAAILDLPLKRGWQYLKLARLENDPKAIFFNPYSDRAKSDWLRTVNAEVNAGGAQ